MPEYHASTVQTFMIEISGVAPRQQASEQLWEMSMSHEHDTLTIRNNLDLLRCQQARASLSNWNFSTA